MSEPIRILLVDDHPVVRSGIRAMLLDQPGFELVGEVATGAEGVAEARRLRPDVVLMDLQLGAGIHGSEATRQITAAGASAPRVLVLTTFDTDADILAVVEARHRLPAQGRASGEALRRDPVGRRRGQHARAQRRLPPPRPDAVPAATLTAREPQVLELVAEGLSNRQIGKRLFLSETTIKTHLVHIYAKLDVDSRTAAVAAATRRGLIRSS